jgi:tRNA threonylcarbamoyladenosine biosynthesis protein TsaB
MAAATINQVSGKLVHKNTLISPMIDARRMEVYTAVYDRHLAQVSAPVAMILDSASYHEWLDQHGIIFSGNGMLKWKSLCTHHHAVFADHVNATAMDMAGLSYEYYTEKRFADLSYAEPLYLKEFHTPARK